MSSGNLSARPIFTVLHNMGSGNLREVKLELLGGYAIDRTTVVIFHDPSGPRDGLIELRRDGIARPVTRKSIAIDLQAGDFERFEGLPVHYQFMLGNRWWRKLPVDQLARRLRSRTWRTV